MTTNSKTFFIMIFLILTIPASLFVGYLHSQTNIKKEFYDEKLASFGPFFKDIHYMVVAHGQVVNKGSYLTLDNSGDQINILFPPSYTAMTGKDYKGNDFPNWKSIKGENINIGDEVYVSGYYHPKDKYIIPFLIFIKSR